MILLVATIGSLLVMIVSPINAILVYFACLIWYPSAITLQLGMIDISAQRIICIALIIKLIMNHHLIIHYKHNAVDKLMLAYFVSQIVSGLFTTDCVTLINNRCGWFIDTCIPYFVIRIFVQNKQQLFFVLKGIVIIASFLALAAVAESITHKEFLAFGRGAIDVEPRWGLARARATLNHPIYFGVFMAMVFGISVSIWAVYSAWIFKLLSLCLVAGVFSCLSSGGWLCAVVIIFVILLYGLKKYWKLIIILFVCLCFFIEIASNRHFYEVVDRFAFNAQTAWYRSRLIEVALFEGGMSGHWIFGYGYGVDPMWCSQIDGRGHTDIVNQYLYILVCFGLIGFIPYVLQIAYTFQRIYIKIFQVDRKYCWLMWCFGATLIGLIFTYFSVSLFGQATNFVFIFLALSTNLPDMILSKSSINPYQRRTR